MEADASHQWDANEKLTKLLESFGNSTNRFNEKVPNYPAYYGGAYITEKGSLMIYVMGDLEKGKQAVKTVIGNTNVEFKAAEHSYSYLTTVMD